ncbi:hypothetical protein H634G_02027 [Metarhizium anisopliae BRIP 53293]|uniref:ABM domain-containing protein n=1 Tax=Metarhizium anisopliae BRIP 53293 TaxID=1291518 RepID=A0A0D9PDL3_METAN|nr:hypothetical protein H634G_02027 [Metarhizium anisopliae BRIP 53293]KJK93523.1 hypothetical protein H633G_02724 [Metarhizium anisopliae BRIP 53284]
MPVTEFAIICLRSGGFDELDFLEALMEVQEIQDSWTRVNHPYNLEPNSNLSSMYIEHSDPPSLLITAPWDSPEDHGEWIRSTDNQMCNAKLAHYIKPGCSSALLQHLSPAGKDEQLRRAFLNKDSFSVARITVEPGVKRDKLQEAYEREERDVDLMEGDQKLWAGWRMEKRHGNEELVVFWTDEVPEGTVQKLIALGDGSEQRRFRHVV